MVESAIRNMLAKIEKTFKGKNTIYDLDFEPLKYIAGLHLGPESARDNN